MKRWTAALLAAAILAALILPASAAGSSYSDVPADSWALSLIETAKADGLMSGQGSGKFGYGRTVTNAEFAKMLCNLLGWTLVKPAAPSFGDVPKTAWYYSCVETALANGAMDKTASFSPSRAITRRQMAVMFVRALGLKSAAEAAYSKTSPFTDVTADSGYINVAYEIGMITGISSTKFAPESTALREQTAAMLVRVYGKIAEKTDFIHGFYAISSYSQLALAKKMNAVTYMWSTMKLTDGKAELDTSSSEYRIPDSYENAASALSSAGVKQHLGVYMDVSGGVDDLLLSDTARSQSVNAILSELTRTYDALGANPYSGVTIDFEGLKGTDVKTAYNSFLTALSAKLRAAGMTLYVTVQPATPDGVYYDGFDFKAIGTLADKIILMAHDYNPTSLAGYEGTTWYKNAALTPISQVYYALKTATDPETGVSDPSKLALSVSFANQGWQIDADGKLLSGTPVWLSASALTQRVTSPASVKGFSDTYRDPYLTYTSDSGDRYFIWYENERSVAEKLRLAKLFGVTGVSAWRLGNIPDTDGYRVSDALTH